MDIFRQFAFDDVIRIGIASVVIIATLISMLYIIWWGFLMIVSGWNEEKIKPAINHIRHAIIWFVFIFWVIFVFPVLMNLVWLSYGEYAKPRMVFATVTDIFGKIFWDTMDDSLVIPNDTGLPDDFSSDF
jgi:hypothetical protein